MTERVRIGIAGTSWFADLVHLPLLKSDERAELVAICGRNGERTAEMAHKYGIPGVFTDYRRMFEQAGLDAVVVITPDDTHYPITMAALDAGLHVLCEKPLALDARQAREMHEKAEAARVKHMTFFTYRWMPTYRYLRRLIDEGYLGHCFHCHFSYEGDYGRSGQYGWRFDRARGNGILGDLGAHMIDLARWYVGDIARVSAHLATHVERPGPDGRPLDPANDSAALLLEFANGAQGTLHVGAVAHVAERGEQRVQLYGQAGTLEADSSWLDTEIRGARQDEKALGILRIPDDLAVAIDPAMSGSDETLKVFGRPGLADHAFVDAIVEDRPASPSFYDALKVQEVIDAALESDRTGCWVSLQ